MKHSIKTGLTFGLTSGIITTLGLIVGIYSGTHAKLPVIGAVLVIAIADALSDALGIHLSEESEGKHNACEIWESTISTFIAKFVFALTFIVPLLLFQLRTAVIASVIWGMAVLAVLSFYIAKWEKTRPWKVVSEHLLIASLVVVLTLIVGNLVSSFFG